VRVPHARHHPDREAAEQEIVLSSTVEEQSRAAARETQIGRWHSQPSSPEHLQARDPEAHAQARLSTGFNPHLVRRCFNIRSDGGADLQCNSTMQGKGESTKKQMPNQAIYLTANEKCKCLVERLEAFRIPKSSDYWECLVIDSYE
jgi:hypothetical protein